LLVITFNAHVRQLKHVTNKIIHLSCTILFINTHKYIIKHCEN